VQCHHRLLVRLDSSGLVGGSDGEHEGWLEDFWPGAREDA
jgi:hypothetical protein